MTLRLLPLLMLLAACHSKATLIGTPCTKSGDCNVAGQLCAKGICTRQCNAIFDPPAGSSSNSMGCPIGYDCYDSGENLGALTCNKAGYTVDANGKPVLFGLDCSTPAGGPSVCMKTMDPAPQPLCRVGESPVKLGQPLADDPSAYCTATCTADTDCPYNYYCGKDYDSIPKCLKRGACATCVYDDQCYQPGHAGEFFCVPPDNPSLPSRAGATHYCAKRCSNGNDCPGAALFPPIIYTQCLPATSSTGLTTGFCLHRYGACVGQGEICDPCRTDDDCAKSKTRCITNTQTLEQMCTRSCTSDANCAGPNNATCETTMYGACTGDPTHQFPGQFTCWGNIQ